MAGSILSYIAVPLERANSFSGGIQNGSLVVGVPLAGILISVMGTSNVLWLDEEHDPARELVLVSQ